MFARFICWFKRYHEDVLKFDPADEEHIYKLRVRCLRCGRESMGVDIPAKPQTQE